MDRSNFTHFQIRPNASSPKNVHHNITDDEKSNGGEEGDGEGKLNGEHDEDERKRSAEVQQELIDSLQSKLDDSQTQIDTYQGEPAAVFSSI